MANIIVIEPHKLLRLGLMKLLTEASGDDHIDGVDYEPLDSGHASARPYDLALLSIPAFDDAQRLIQSVQRIYAPRAILLLSDSPSLPAQARTLPSVVAGHLMKNAQPEIVQASVRLVLAGGTCFPLHTRATDRRDPGQTQVGPPPGFMSSMAANAPPAANQSSMVGSMPLNGLNGSDKAPGSSDDRQPEWELLGLTRRQYEVLVLLARGYPMKTVGRYLNISVATAKAHTETLYQRLDVHNRNAAVYAAVAKGATLGLPNMANGKQAVHN
jgi:DNA-binding NarL/FixJ family response regulator